VLRANYTPCALLARGWKALRNTLAVAEQLPHDVSCLLRNARRGRLHVSIELAHFKRVGDQIDRAASRLAMTQLIAALVVGSSIVMNVQGGPTLFGLPLFGFLGFVAAVAGGVWLLRSIARSGRSGREDDSVRAASAGAARPGPGVLHAPAHPPRR
jgi:ubiquinone biosynthesis protein